MLSKGYVNKVAILGSGVMGAQIAAHFANAQIPVLLLDLKSPTGGANALGEKALANLVKLKPEPIANKQATDFISIGNYDDDLEQLEDCALVIEAIAERLEWKLQLLHKIAPHLNPETIVASNTSGLSIKELSASLPIGLQAHFCGIHFFNPPRYMPLVELIPHENIAQHVLPQLEKFLVTGLGKSVIIAKDTPNFVANRIGVFSLMVCAWHALKYKIPFEVVDELTGKKLGRAKSATFRTADIVGLDTFVHVLATLQEKCHDGFEHAYVLPQWLEQLVKAGALGQKTRGGIYRKDKDGLKVIDIESVNYRPADKKASPEILAILGEKSWAKKLKALHESNEAQGQFLWAIFRDLFHYCALLLGEITDTPRNMDLALRWGFGWKEGVFEIWQQAGWGTVAEWIKEDIEQGKTISQKPLPQWVFDLDSGVYVAGKHFNVKQQKLVELNLAEVYQRQIFPELLLNEKAQVTQHLLYENDGVKLWHSGDNIGVLSFKSKMCAIGLNVLTGLEEALSVAENECIAMVICQEDDIFSVGANLEEFGFSIMMNGSSAVDSIISAGHRVIANKIRYSKIPIVAGVKGYAFGGGCEIMLHCTSVVAALESYVGLIEAGVGLLPGWGGTTEMVRRASCARDSWIDLTRRYENLAMAKVATSAYQARDMGFLRDSDTIVMNSREVLMIAREKARFLASSGYRPPVKSKYRVFGEQGIANINALLTNLFAGRQISEHDLLIARSIAVVMCGGACVKDSKVSEGWLLKLEKEQFIQLAISDKTAARIQYMLEKGKPLRN